MTVEKTQTTEEHVRQELEPLESILKELMDLTNDITDNKLPLSHTVLNDLHERLSRGIEKVGITLVNTDLEDKLFMQVYPLRALSLCLKMMAREAKNNSNKKRIFTFTEMDDLSSSLCITLDTMKKIID